MKTFIVAVALLFLSLSSKADVTYTTEPPRESAKGRLQTTIGKRGDAVVHRITRIDRGNKGTFNEYAEEFFVEGTVVLYLSRINGDYMVDCRNLGTGVVSLYYKGESQRPEKLLVGRDESSSEVYISTEDGSHIAVIDDDRKTFLAKLGPIRGSQTNIQPNQRPERNAGATSVSPSAPGPGVAHP